MKGKKIKKKEEKQTNLWSKFSYSMSKIRMKEVLSNTLKIQNGKFHGREYSEIQSMGL